jgi:Tol biopolymer transport system component
VYLLATDGSREVPFVQHPADEVVVGWTPEGKHLLFTSDRAGSVGLYALACEDGKPIGEAKSIKSDMGRAASIGLTQSGMLYFALLPGSRDLLVASVDFDSRRILEPAVPAAQQFLGTNYGPDWSPDGRYLSYESYRLRQANVLLIYSAETKQTKEIRPPLRYFNLARWSPDSRSLLTQATDLKGRQGVYRMDPRTGATEAILLSDPGVASAIPQWATDGKKIYFRRLNPARKIDALVERDLGSGAERDLLSGTELRWFSVAPDGRRLACATMDPATKESSIFILEIATGEKRMLLPPNSGFTHPDFTPDGRRILLRKQGEIWTVPPAGGDPRKVDLGLTRITDLRVHPDGRRIALNTRNDTPQEVWVAENILSTLNGRK